MIAGLPSTSASHPVTAIALNPGRSGSRLIAIVFADMVGYSRLIGLDAETTFHRLRTLHAALIGPEIAACHGRLVNTAGDSILAEFPSVEAALRFALEFQRRVPEFDTEDADRCLRFRVGINIADVFSADSEIAGDGVNIAARLQTACPPGEICVSSAVRDQAGGSLALSFEPLGKVKFKNIARPVETFIVRRAASQAGLWPRLRLFYRRSPIRRWGMRIVLAGILLVGASYSMHVVKPRLELTAQAAMPDLNPNVAPLLSMAVLPFKNLSGDGGEDYLADGLTDDLTSVLSHIPDALVIAGQSAYTYRDRTLDVRQIGTELGIRYVVSGSVRKVQDDFRVNTELISTQTGAIVWTARFERPLRDLSAGQDEIVDQIRSALNVELVAVESKPGARPPSSNPEAFDLVLRARALLNRPITPKLLADAETLYQQALALDSSSVPALVGMAELLTRMRRVISFAQAPDLERAATLLDRAEKLRPGSLQMLNARAQLLRNEYRWAPAITLYQQVLAQDPNAAGALVGLAESLDAIGKPEQAVPLYLSYIRRNPRDPNLWTTYANIGWSLAKLDRIPEAITWFRKALESYSGGADERVAEVHRNLASADALTGNMAEARTEAAAAAKLSPWRTARYYVSLEMAADAEHQNARYAEGLRLAGTKDHADENEDMGVPSTAELKRGSVLGYTPTSVPGGRVITTDELRKWLAGNEAPKPLLLDINMGRRALPGTRTLIDIGSAGTDVNDWVQDRARRAVAGLTGGDLDQPIVTIGWNSERWGGRNLALRLIAMGYRNVYWYRGGREAWEVAGGPETELIPVDW